MGNEGLKESSFSSILASKSTHHKKEMSGQTRYFSNNNENSQESSKTWAPKSHADHLISRFVLILKKLISLILSDTLIFSTKESIC